MGREDSFSKIDEGLIPEKVSFSDYLPNFIKKSPVKREYSQTYKTMKYYPKKRSYLSGGASTMASSFIKDPSGGYGVQSCISINGGEIDAEEMQKILYSRPSV